MAFGQISVKRTVYFDRFRGDYWPSPAEIEPFFLAPKGKEWSYRGGNDSWVMSVSGLYDTADRPDNDQVSVSLAMIGNPELGVYLDYRKWDGRIRQGSSYSPKGDLTRLLEFVDSLHETPLSIGLFIPFPKAWRAVKEFMETDGALPTSIEWIADYDLPPEAFPVPGPPSQKAR
jgi:hypothetical protein